MRKKLSVGLVAIVLVFGIALAVPFVGVLDLVEQLQRSQQANEHLEQAYELHLLGRNLQSTGMNISMMGGEMVMEGTRNRLSQLEERYQSLREDLLSADFTGQQHDYASIITDRLDRFFEIVETNSAGMLTGDTNVPARYLDRTEVDTGDTLEETFRALTSSIAEQARAESAQTILAAERRMRYTGVAALVALVVAAVVGVIMSRAIMHPIRRTNVLLKDLVEGGGNLQAQLEAGSNDEIAHFARQFNSFTDTIRSIVEEIKQQTEEGASIGRHLAASMNESSSATTEISANVSSIRDQLSSLDEHIADSKERLDQMTSRIGELDNRISHQREAVHESSTNIEQIGSSLTNLANITKERETTAHTLVQLTEHGEYAVEQTSKTIQDAANQTSEISRLVEVVNDISSQTNLLAMNAAIEAAHAGEEGKGFAVVAEEIRSLAESTSENARDISQTVQSTVQKINAGLSASKQSGEAFEQIKQEVGSVSSSIQELSSGIAELSTSSDEIVRAVQTLRELTSQVTSDASEIHGSAGQVTETINQVHQISSRVLEGVNEVNSGVKEIAQSINDVNEISERNRQMIMQIEQTVHRFQT